MTTDGWLTWLVEVFRSGRGLPLLAVGVVIVLLMYLTGLLLSMVIPGWRRSQSSH